MSTTIVILGSLVLLLFVGLLTVIRIMTVPASDERLTILTGAGKNQEGAQLTSENRKSTIQKNIATKSSTKKLKSKISNDVIMFQAGIFSDDERQEFNRKCFLVLAIATPICAFIGFYMYSIMGLGIGAALGILIGRAYPDKLKNSLIASRQEEASYYLPLAIEQLSMGVSSGLDIGPCIAYAVDMADQRGANNVVIELFAHALKLSKAGMSLEESLLEVGSICGSPPVQNTFMFLAQCSKHGGEISKQLLELSEAVTSERQSIIEAKINALPNKSTVALILVFAGFFVMILTGIGMKIMAGLATS